MPRAKRLLSWLLTALFVLLAWLMIAYRLPGPAIVVSRETTFLTDPLHADGLPDYTRHLLDKEREGVTPENNGAIPFLQAMWPAGLDERDYRPLCNELGMEIPNQRGMTYPNGDKELQSRLAEWLVSLDPDRAEVAREEVERAEEDLEWGEFEDEGQEEEYDPKDHAYELTLWALAHPWRREEIPLLAEWVDRHAPQFDLLHEAAARERFYCPSPDLLGTPQLDMGARLPVGHEIGSAIGDCLGLRANLALGEGDIAAAWRDCRAMFRLAGHVPREFMRGELMSINSEGFAHETARSILSDPHLDAATAREMLEFVRELPPRGRMGELVDTWERMTDLSYYIGMSRQGSELRRLEDDDEESPSTKRMLRSLDWNAILRKINTDYDGIVRQVAAAEAGKNDEAPAGWIDPDDAPMGIAESIKVYVSRKERTEQFIRRAAWPTMAGWSQALQLQRESNAGRQLLTVAAAVIVYRLEQGAYPEHLADLVPDLLPALPADPFHGSPPVYRRMNEGFLLYSLGPNGQDDGGSNDQHDILEGIEVVLYDLEETLENENQIRKLLGRPPVTKAEFAELVKSAEEAGQEENKVRAVKRLAEEIPAGADDHTIRLPLPRLKLKLSGE